MDKAEIGITCKNSEQFCDLSLWIFRAFTAFSCRLILLHLPYLQYHNCVCLIPQSFLSSAFWSGFNFSFPHSQKSLWPILLLTEFKKLQLEVDQYLPINTVFSLPCIIKARCKYLLLPSPGASSPLFRVHQTCSFSPFRHAFQQGCPLFP